MARLYGALQLDTDVAIASLLEALDVSAPERPASAVQQYVGSYVSRLNRRLKAKGQRVIPGQLKRTYRLVNV
jgi:hypothetical protein